MSIHIANWEINVQRAGKSNAAQANKAATASTQADHRLAEVRQEQRIAHMREQVHYECMMSGMR